MIASNNSPRKRRYGFSYIAFLLFVLLFSISWNRLLMNLVLDTKELPDHFLLKKANGKNENMMMNRLDDINTKSLESPTDDGTSVSFPGSYYENPPKSRFAYAALLVDCDLDRPSYRGFLYNIVVAVFILRLNKSTQDVVVYIQMAQKSKRKRLPDRELLWLHKLGCRIIFLPTPVAFPTVVIDESTDTIRWKTFDFSDSQMNKFHILDLVEYDRVLYIDSDVMPLCNLDYIFYLSIDGVIKENMVVAWTREPANGGFFMLQPARGYKNELFGILNKTRQRPFDTELGWGQEFVFPDQWLNFNEKKHGDQWVFYAADSDQGLLYHWTKYHRKSVTIVSGEDVENWGVDPDNPTMVMKEKSFQPFANSSCVLKNFILSSRYTRFIRKLSHKKFLHDKRTLQQFMKESRYSFHPSYGHALIQIPPYSDFIHFYGRFKPWDDGQPLEPDCMERTNATSARQYFFHILRKCNRALNMGIDFGNWTKTADEIRLPKFEERRVNWIKF